MGRGAQVRPAPGEVGDEQSRWRLRGSPKVGQGPNRGEFQKRGALFSPPQSGLLSQKPAHGRWSVRTHVQTALETHGSPPATLTEPQLSPGNPTPHLNTTPKRPDTHIPGI